MCKVLYVCVVDTDSVLKKIISFLSFLSFFLGWRRKSKFWKLVARREKVFPFFLSIFLVAELPQNGGVLICKNLFASCQSVLS